MAYLKVFVPGHGHVDEYAVSFGKTLAAMNDCYLALRRATAVTPVP